MDKTLVKAIKRLQNANKRNLNATESFYDAVDAMAWEIEKAVPAGTELPRGYKVIRVKSNVGSEVFLTSQNGNFVDGTGSYLHGDFNCFIPTQNRDDCIQFAHDVANGLLDDIAEFLENRATDAENATATLQSCGPIQERT